MKKILSMLAATAMALSLLVSCASSPKEATPPPAPEKFKVEIVNKTSDIVLAVLCVAEFPPEQAEECLYGNAVLFPEEYALKDPKLPYKLVTHLERGLHVIFIMGKDLRTEKYLGTTSMLFEVVEDDEFIIKDKRVNVKKGVIHVKTSNSF